MPTQKKYFNNSELNVSFGVLNSKVWIGLIMSAFWTQFNFSLVIRIVCSFWKKASNKLVCVFICASLSWVVRVTKIELHLCCHRDFFCDGLSFFRDHTSRFLSNPQEILCFFWRMLFSRFSGKNAEGSPHPSPLKFVTTSSELLTTPNTQCYRCLTPHCTW